MRWIWFSMLVGIVKTGKLVYNYHKTQGIVAEQGEWLPEASQLLAWLKSTDFHVAISMDETSYYAVQATDTINHAIYVGGDYSLANALANVILKICKSHLRAYTPKSSIRALCD